MAHMYGDYGAQHIVQVTCIQTKPWRLTLSGYKFWRNYYTFGIQYAKLPNRIMKGEWWSITVDRANKITNIELVRNRPNNCVSIFDFNGWIKKNIVDGKLCYGVCVGYWGPWGHIHDLHGYCHVTHYTEIGMHGYKRMMVGQYFSFFQSYPLHAQQTRPIARCVRLITNECIILHVRKKLLECKDKCRTVDDPQQCGFRSVCMQSMYYILIFGVALIVL